MSRPKLTPMLEQYFEIKRQVPDAILFYRLGDFYEMFFEDAELAAPLLDLVLTARHKGQENEAPMCGVPYHAADGYIAKLIKQGMRVAICDQVEEPAAAKGLVRREIVRIVTPGTATESNIVERESCYLLALVPRRRGPDRRSAPRISTSRPATFSSRTTAASTMRGSADDVARFAPREAIFPRDGNGFAHIAQLGVAATPVEPSMFEARGAHDYLTKHFGTQSLRGFGLDGRGRAHRRRGRRAALRDGEPQADARSRADAAGRQRRRVPAARRRDAGEPRDRRVARRGAAEGDALVGGERHALGDGSAHAAALAPPSARDRRGDLRAARCGRGADALRARCSSR